MQMIIFYGIKLLHANDHIFMASNFFMQMINFMRRSGLVVGHWTAEQEVGGVDPHSGRHVVSLSKLHLPPKSTGNAQEAVSPSHHD